MTQGAGNGEHTHAGLHGRALADETRLAHRSRLAWKAQQLRVWDKLQLTTPWLLLTVSTASYLVGLQAADEPLWPGAATALGLVAVSALWVLFSHTLPLGRRRLGPLAAGIYFVGLLALCLALMAHSEVFLVFAIAGFFHAYLLTPWPVGVLAVLTTSVVLNGSAMGVLASPTSQVLAQFVVVVAVQTAAIGVGIVLTSRSEREERRREQLVARLERALHENAGLHAQLVAQARESGAQDERQRLAGEIHDTLAQGLAGIITQLQAAQRSPAGRGETERHVARALELARSSLTEARRSVRALAPQALHQARLPDALRTMAERWSLEHGVRVQMEVTGVQEALSPALEVSLFRVAQECLTNVAKHAQATRVGVTLSYAGAEVLLDVRDDGRGFVSEGCAGFGLTSMRQRIRGVGGHLDVQSAPGDGTAVSARVPAIALGGARRQEGTD